MRFKDYFLIVILGIITLYVSSQFEAFNRDTEQDIAQSSERIIALLREEIRSINVNLRRQHALNEFGCGSCHSEKENALPKGKLSYSSFVCFLENTCRWVNNPNFMPTYNLNEKELRHLFSEIYE